MTMWNRLWALMAKEFIQIQRDRRTLGMMIFIPILWLVMFGYAVNFDVTTLKVALLNKSSAPLSESLARALNESKNVELVKGAETPEDIRELLRKGEAQVGVIVPPSGRTEVLVDGSDYFGAQTGVRLMGTLFQQVQREELVRMSPLPLALPALGAGLSDGEALFPKIDVLYNPDLKSSNVMIPGLLGMVLAFAATLMTALGVVRERERGTLEQLVVTPLRSIELMLGKMLPYALIAMIDFAFVLAAGLYLFDVPFHGNLFLFGTLSFFFLLCALGLGLLISTLAQNQQQAMQLAVLSLIPQFLLSGFVFPLAAMPEVIRSLAYVLPLTYFMPIARGMFLKGAGLDLLTTQAAALGIYGAAMITIASMRFRKRLG